MLHVFLEKLLQSQDKVYKKKKESFKKSFGDLNLYVHKHSMTYGDDMEMIHLPFGGFCFVLFLLSFLFYFTKSDDLLWIQTISLAI